jgi:hypothetical protein
VVTLDQGCQMVCFQTKIRIWVNFGWPKNGECWYILWLFEILFGNLVYFMAIW